MKKQQENTRHQKTQFKEIFCAENGYLSSKRVLGAIVLLGCLTIVSIEAIKEGITTNIRDLIEVLIITATTLLGITSVTNAWKAKKTTIKNINADNNIQEEE